MHVQGECKKPCTALLEMVGEGEEVDARRATERRVVAAKEPGEEERDVEDDDGDDADDDVPEHLAPPRGRALRELGALRARAGDVLVDDARDLVDDAVVLAHRVAQPRRRLAQHRRHRRHVRLGRFTRSPSLFCTDTPISMSPLVLLFFSFPCC